MNTYAEIFTQIHLMTFHFLSFNFSYMYFFRTAYYGIATVSLAA